MAEWWKQMPPDEMKTPEYQSDRYGPIPTLPVLVTTKPDADRAAELKTRLAEAWGPVLSIMDEAARAGFLVRWIAIQPGSFGRHEVMDLHLVKRF